MNRVFIDWKQTFWEEYLQVLKYMKVDPVEFFI